MAVGVGRGVEADAGVDVETAVGGGRGADGGESRSLSTPHTPFVQEGETTTGDNAGRRDALLLTESLQADGWNCGHSFIVPPLCSQEGTGKPN